MSIVHIQQIQAKVIELFADKIDSSDISLTDTERKIKITTRCLAAYAVYCSVECTLEDAASSIVDGGDDNGIDAIYYSVSDKMMVIVQSKFSQNGGSEPPAAEVGKFCQGVRDLMALNFDRFNDKVKSKVTIIDNAIRDFDTSYKLVFIDTYTSQTFAKHSLRLLEDLLNEMNDTGDDSSDPIFTFEHLAQAGVHISLANKVANTPINVDIMLKSWGMVTEPYKAYFGVISGKEITDWWGKYRDRLFDKNIRKVLGKTDVNDEIEKTIKDAPSLFWYFNNGITVVAERIEKSALGGNNRDSGLFKLTNFAIVNGAQTVSTIGRYAGNISEEELNDLKVQMRIIQLSDTPENFGNNVTKANNRQNRIENRDFVSQDSEQLRIKRELSIDGIEYNIMRSDGFISSSKSFDVIEATAALACASEKTSLVVLSKSNIGKFYENLDRGVYKELFNPSISGYYVYNSVRTIRQIESIIKDRINHLVKKSGKEYGVLIHGNRLVEMLIIKQAGIKGTMNSMEYTIDENLLSRLVDSTVSKIVTFLEINYPDSFPATVFKNVSKSSEIETYVLSN